MTHPEDSRPNGPRRQSFLLTLWQEQAGGPWRASLRPNDGGERQGFATVEHLAAHLLRLTTPDAGSACAVSDAPDAPSWRDEAGPT